MPDRETMITLYKINQNNYEVQFSINPMLKDKIEKKNQLKNDLSQTKIICQTLDLGHETGITH
jgi:hypothetical protein